jgi:hypothetical protein
MSRNTIFVYLFTFSNGNKNIQSGSQNTVYLYQSADTKLSSYRSMVYIIQVIQ